MGIYLTGIAWVVGAAALAGFVGYLVRRFGWDEGRPDNNDAAGQVFTIVGGLHAVLLAFVLISLFDGVSAAEDGAYQEADSLVAAYWAADSLPEPTKSDVQDLARSYTATVADTEWSAMISGGEVAGEGWSQLDQLRKSVSSATVTDEWQNGRKTEAASQLWQVYQARQARLDTAGSDGVSGVVWFALIVGSILSVALPVLFGGPRPVTHIIIVSILAGTLALLLFATQQLQNPYSGGAQVGSDAFQIAQERLK